MTRKDYILIAEALRIPYLSEVRNESPQHADGILMAASEIADSLQRDNLRFNREHFLAVVRGEKELMSRPSRNGVRP
jgi:hypothetical protein